MGDFKKEYIKIGDYVYMQGNYGFWIGKVSKLETSRSNCIEVWGDWSTNVVSALPRTLEEFDEVEKEYNAVSLEVIDGLLSFEKEDLSTLSEKLLNLDSYESSVIVSLNEFLGDKLDLEDFLKLLVPSVVRIADETRPRIEDLIKILNPDCLVSRDALKDLV